MGGESWSGFWINQESSNASNSNPSSTDTEDNYDLYNILDQDETVAAIKGRFSLAWQSLKHVITQV